MRASATGQVPSAGRYRAPETTIRETIVKNLDKERLLRSSILAGFAAAADDRRACVRAGE
jgi:hypothetical protein